MHPVLTIATRAALEAGKIVREGNKQLEYIEIYEKNSGDFVSQVDLQAEDIIKTILFDKYPDHFILAEESGMNKKNKRSIASDDLWIVDPLDGTSNYLHGLNYCAISIAYLHKNKLEAALVYNPFTEELFTATRGQGALLNNRKIRVNSIQTNSNVLIGTGFPFKNPVMMEKYFNFLQEILKIYPDIRRSGSAALDLCSVAAGRLQGFFELGLKSWDIAAGSLIVQEAGGIVSSMQIRESFLKTGNIIAGGYEVHNELQKICVL